MIVQRNSSEKSKTVHRQKGPNVVEFLAIQSQQTNWWVANKDLLALGISLAALVWSVLSTRHTIRRSEAMTRQTMDRTENIAHETSRNNAHMARISTYQRIHEMLIAPEAAKGRRLLFIGHRKGKFPSLGMRGWDEINYSLALYDTLGGYVHHNQVDEDIVLSAWHHPLQNIAEPVRMFMQHRKKHNIQQPWAYLHQLISLAQYYECRCALPITEPVINRDSRK